jgi:Uma2 family endonuclease
MRQRLSREEFRRWAAGQGQRYERLAGEPIAMAPERIEHARIKSRIWAAFDRAIKQNNLPCEALPDGVTVEVDTDTDYEPDAVVNCGPPAPGDAIAATNPVIVVEVLSPSAEHIDLADKLADYFRVPSIQHYLIVRALRREVIHHRRSGSEIIGRVINIGDILMEPPGITINLSDVYPGQA